MSNSESNTARRQVGVLALFGMLTRVCAQAMTLALLLLAGRFLTVELFGIFVLASILMNFAIMQMYSGIYYYVLREPEFEANKRTAFSLQILISFLFMGVILMAAGLTYAMGWGELLAALIAATALAPFFALFGSWQEAILLREGKVNAYYLALFLSEVSGFAVSVWLLMDGFGVWALIANRYIAAILFGLFLTYSAGLMPRPGWSASAARKIMNYALGLYGGVALSFFSSYGAAIILGGFLNATAVGLFRMASRTAGAATEIFSQTSRILTWQAVGRMAREGRLSPELWTRLLAVNLTVLMFVLGSLSILAEDLTMVLLGDEWLGIVPILKILCWVNVFAAIHQIAGAQLAAAGYTKFLFRAGLVEASLLLVCLLFSVQYGMIVVAYALFLPVIVFDFILLRKLIQVTEAETSHVWNAFAPSVLSAGLALAAVYGVSAAFTSALPLVKITLTAVAGSLAFLFIAFILLRPWTLRTLQIISVAILPAKAASASGSS